MVDLVRFFSSFSAYTEVLVLASTVRNKELLVKKKKKSISYNAELLSTKIVILASNVIIFKF